jgi:transglutaminase-like putative cysteine protease
MQLGNGRSAVELPPPTPEDTLVWMRQLAQRAQSDLGLRELAEEIVHHVFGHDYLSEYAAILNWVRSHVRYTRDPRTIEQVKSPRAVVETGHADCDDMATLISALIGHLGGATRFVAGAFKRGPGGRSMLAHVWCEAFDPPTNTWVVLDPVPGKRVPQMLGSTIDRISLSAIE